MKEQESKKSEMAKKLNLTRQVLDRLLDNENISITLNTLTKAVNGMGKKLQFNIV
jgi:DNA-binding phage protein